MFKKIKNCTFIVIGFYGICFGASWHTESLITHAEKCELAKSYQEASELYLKAAEISDSKNEDLRKKLLWQAAYTSFLSNDNVKTLTILEEIEDHTPGKWFLKGLVQRRAGKNQEAETSFLTYLDEGTSQQQINRTNWELSRIYFEDHQYDRAIAHLKSLAEQKDVWLTPLANLDIAWDLIRREQYEEAFQQLTLLDLLDLPSEEYHYHQKLLRGKILIYLEREEEALQNFQFLFQKLADSHPFTRDLHYLSGWAYLKLASKTLYDPTWQEKYFDLAISHFEQIADGESKEEAILSLAQAHLAKGKNRDEPFSIEAAEALLDQIDLLSGREARARALLIRAEATADGQDKDRLFRLLTSESFRGNHWFIHGWLLRGLNELSEGQRYLKEGDIVLAHDAFIKSDQSFQQAFIEAKESSPSTAIEALIWRVEALLIQQNPTSAKKGYQLISQFLKENKEMITASEQEDEVTYLYGKAAWGLKTEGGYEKAKKSWQNITQNHVHSSWAPTALFSLASMEYERKNYEEAKKIFIHLQQEYPSSSYAGDALYFASICEEALKTPYHQIAEIRRKVWQKYPHSHYAAEACYHEYPFSAYLAGSPEALQHLRLFMKNYEDSPYIIHAYYLEGLHHLEKDLLTQAIEAFHQAEKKSSELQQDHLIPYDQQEYYTALRDHCTLQRALAELQTHSNLEEIQKQEKLEEILATLTILQKRALESKKNHSFSDEMEPLVEEASYALGQTHLLLGNRIAAEKVFDDLMQSYKEKKITRGYYLSRTWFKKGELAFDRSDYLLALEYLNQAEDCGRGKILKSDQLLELWILKSHCYRQLKNFDQAMWYLSRAANESVIAPKRLEAMYLRAEIYQEQGRDELALRQLQTLAAAGGIWGEKATNKLKTMGK